MSQVSTIYGVGIHTVTIPSDIDTVTLRLSGAGGGNGGANDQHEGGYGASLVVTYDAATYGRTLYLRVGAKGYNGNPSSPLAGRGGWDGGNGFGADTTLGWGAGGGGGSSLVAIASGWNLADIIAWAGAGGGGGASGDGTVFGRLGGGGGGGGYNPGGGGGAFNSGTSSNAGGSPGTAHVTTTSGKGGNGAGVAGTYSQAYEGAVGGDGGNSSTVTGTAENGDGFQDNIDYDFVAGRAGTSTLPGAGGLGTMSGSTVGAGGGGGGTSWYDSSRTTLSSYSRGTNINDGTITVQWESNDPPSAPIPGSRPNFDANDDADFTWVFTDPNPDDSQTAYRIEIDNASTGASAWNSGKVTSTTSARTLAGGTLANGVGYRWRVKTWDAEDFEGDWSDYRTFDTAAKPTSAFTTPASEGATVTSASLQPHWSYTDSGGNAQGWYQLRLLDAAGTTVIEDTGKTASSTTTRVLSTSLENSTDYTLEITVWNTKNVASTPAERTFTVDYVEPETPTFTLSAEDDDGYITVDIDNGTPASTAVPDVSYNEVYRRISGTTDWTFVASNVGPDGIHRDYNAASGYTWEYMVRAVSTSGSKADSTTATSTLTLQGVWLHLLAAPESSVRQYQHSGKHEEEFDPMMGDNHYVGRTYPSSEVSTQQRSLLSARIQASTAQLKTIRALLEAREAMVMRDGRGGRSIGALTMLDIDETPWGAYVTVEVEQTEDTEVVS